MLGLNAKDFRTFLLFSAVVLTMPIWMSPFHGSVPFYQHFAVFGLFAIGFNLLFGLTGYLSFGHAAMYGTGAIAAYWSLKLLSLHAFPALVFGGVMAGLLALIMGFLCLRRSGIYFSILTLAFAVMMYQLAIPQKTLTGGDDTIGLSPGLETVFEMVEVPVMKGEEQAVDSDGNLKFQSVSRPKNDADGNPVKRWKDSRVFDRAIGVTADDSTANFGLMSVRETEDGSRTFRWFSLNTNVKTTFDMDVPVIGHLKIDYQIGATAGAVLLILGFYLSIRITRSSFGLMLRAVKTNQTRMGYTGLQPKRYTLAVFVISGVYAGVAGALFTILISQTTAERMLWTTSGEVVIMTILGGVGTLIGPVLGAGIIEYLKEFLSAISIDVTGFWTGLQRLLFGETWHLTLGLVFMFVVAFLPGGLMTLPAKIRELLKRGDKS